MKSSIKKILSATAVIIMLFATFAVTAFAEDYGNFSYTPVVAENGEFESYNKLAGYNASDDSTETVVLIPAAIEDVPITIICASAFNGNSKLTEVIIPEGVTTIENAAFLNCSALETVIIPSSVTYIGESAFQDCTALKTVVIGDGVKEIGDLAFKNCTSLTVLDLGNSVEKIGSGAFYNCDSLKRVYVPESVKEIDSLAFGFTQDGDKEAVVPNFTFVTEANKAVYAYNTKYSVVASEDVSSAGEDVSGTTSFTAFGVTSTVVPCADDAHDAKLELIRHATDAFEGLDAGQCSKCLTVVTRPNTEIEPKETSFANYIPAIIVVLAAVGCVVFVVVYIKKSKAEREQAIKDYNEGKPLADEKAKKAQDEKLAAKYAKKRAKQEKRLEIFKK